MKTPYIGFGNDTLARSPNAEVGDKITCPQCGMKHKLDGCTDMTTGKKSSLLLFYKCGSQSYVAAVAGKLIINKKSDLSGAI